MSKYPRPLAAGDADTDCRVRWAASLVCSGTECAVLTLHGNTALLRKSW